jgi:hypothetical protein
VAATKGSYREADRMRAERRRLFVSLEPSAQREVADFCRAIPTPDHRKPHLVWGTVANSPRRPRPRSDIGGHPPSPTLRLDEQTAATLNSRTATHEWAARNQRDRHP